MKHDVNEKWWLAEDVKGHVGYVPAAYLMIILDETLHEEESDKIRTEGNIRGLMEPRLEGRWDRMEKEERYIRRQ